MLIALLAVLGVDLIVLVALATFVLGRKRWVERQPGAFHGVIRVASGEVDGLARTDEVKRLGDDPGVIRVATDGATVEVAARAEDTELLLGPYRGPADATAAGTERS